jgi:hypothetical protein
VECPVEVHRDNRAPGLLGNLLHRPHGLAGDPARAVHQDVQALLRRDQLVDERGDPPRIGHVHDGHAARALGALAHRPPGLAELALEHVACPDRRALARQFHRDGAPDAVSRAGDDRHLAEQPPPCHVLPLP